MDYENEKQVMCIACLEEFSEKDVIIGRDPDGTCPECGAPGPFLEEEYQ